MNSIPARRPRPPVRPSPSVTEILTRPPDLAPAMHTTLAAIDIAAFGDRRRDDEIQLRLRRQMYALVAEACAMGSLPWWDCHREDRGDGALFVAPQQVPAELFLDPLAHHLTAVLRRYNRLAGDTVRLRLRLAVHSGLVHHDDHGVAGHAVVHLFRLLESGAFKRALDGAATDFGLIVSDRLYGDITGRNGSLIDAGAYRELRVTSKETRTRAWAWFPTPRT